MIRYYMCMNLSMNKLKYYTYVNILSRHNVSYNNAMKLCYFQENGRIEIILDEIKDKYLIFHIWNLDFIYIAHTCSNKSFRQVI